MSNWYIGQKVMCVDPIYPLRKGATYTVSSIGDNCQCDCIGVGISNPKTDVLGNLFVPGKTAICANCGAVRTLFDMDRRFFSHRFRPIDSLTEQMDRIEEEGAPVELEPEYA